MNSLEKFVGIVRPFFGNFAQLFAGGHEGALGKGGAVAGLCRVSQANTISSSAVCLPLI